MALSVLRFLVFFLPAAVSQDQPRAHTVGSRAAFHAVDFEIGVIDPVLRLANPPRMALIKRGGRFQVAPDPRQPFIRQRAGRVGIHTVQQTENLPLRHKPSGISGVRGRGMDAGEETEEIGFILAGYSPLVGFFMGNGMGQMAGRHQRVVIRLAGVGRIDAGNQGIAHGFREEDGFGGRPGRAERWVQAQQSADFLIGGFQPLVQLAPPLRRSAWNAGVVGFKSFHKRPVGLFDQAFREFLQLLGGGLIKGGVVYGETDKDGTSATKDEVGVLELYATLYRGLGIDPTPETNASIRDNLGRPYYIAGDKEAAERVDLVLPETGVCSRPVTGAIEADGCCGGPAPAEADACCKQDADAKAGGGKGCGCS